MRVILAALLAAMTVGCSQAYYIRSLDSVEFRDFDARASKNPCLVELDDLTRYGAKEVELARDTTKMYAVDMAQEIQVPTRRVRSITFVYHGESAAGGAAVGLAVKAVIGGVWG